MIDRIVFPTALAIAFVIASALSAQNLTISSAHERTAARGPEAAYTGVGIAEILFRANGSSDLTAAEISFAPGARTAWHNHPAGQYLIVTAGVGWVQARDEEKRTVRAGDVVWTPPGVYHWHGATATESMRHLAAGSSSTAAAASSVSTSATRNTFGDQLRNVSHRR